MDVAELFGGEIKMLPEKPGDRKTVAIDLSRSEGELGWKAEVKLRDHVEEFKDSLK